jgi:hypothetical protein
LFSALESLRLGQIWNKAVRMPTTIPENGFFFVCPLFNNSVFLFYYYLWIFEQNLTVLHYEFKLINILNPLLEIIQFLTFMGYPISYFLPINYFH